MRLVAFFNVIAIIISLVSCQKGEQEPNIIGGTSFLRFYPRACSRVIVSALQADQGERRLNYGHTKDSLVVASRGGVNSDKLVLWMTTGTEYLDSLLQKYPNLREDGVELSVRYNEYGYRKDISESPNQKEIERQLSADYYAPREKSKLARGQVADNLIPWSYRVTGVTDFKITATSTIFGLPAGSSLNDLFSIYDFVPKQIISYKSKALLYGYSDDGKITSIRQWLSMSPMAPPAMGFKLNKIPEELPQDVTFVVSLTTTDNVTLRDTVSVFLR